MINILKKQHGMDIVGQGGKIILFTLPSLAAAILLPMCFPEFAALPGKGQWVKLLGILLLVPGLVLWTAAVIQLIPGFSKGKLVTTGAYSVVRNPIYASAAFFILPAVGLLTFTWVYFIASIFLYAGVNIFIGVEEKQLVAAFGSEYENYLARVDRLIPFKKPRKVSR